MGLEFYWSLGGNIFCPWGGVIGIPRRRERVLKRERERDSSHLAPKAKASLLLAYVHNTEDKTLAQELLFATNRYYMEVQYIEQSFAVARNEVSFTKAKSIICMLISKTRKFRLLTFIVQLMENLQWQVTTHGLLENAVPNAFVIHCIINHQHLTARNLSDPLHKPLYTAIITVNKIKAHALSSLTDQLSPLRIMEVLNIGTSYWSLWALKRQLCVMLKWPFWHCCGILFEDKCFEQWWT